ncbi:MAG: ABC transporter ATP-binding protein [Actinobacteria bacterium]|nr:ABC transporter ATP-binding protein [Actinomycetota bacterium]
MSLVADVGVVLGDLHLDAAFDVADGEVVAVVGPNGSGKTTLLRALAGLVPLASGRIELDGTLLDEPRSATWVPPEQRSVGFVFQDYVLFPHLSAVDNVAFGARCRGVDRRRAAADARSWLERFAVGDMAGCRPAALSGGQAQRVALARALAAPTRLLLLDEPLAALDAAARAEVGAELRRHLSGFAGVCLIVTHDPVEAMLLARRMVVLEAGRVTQQGSSMDVARAPRSTWVAELVGVNLLRGRRSGDGIHLDGGGRLAVTGSGAGEVFAVIHPHAVAVHRARPEGTPRNVWAGRADSMELLGDRARVRVVSADRPPVVAEVTLSAVAELDLDAGGDVWVSIKATEVQVHPA